MLSKNEISLQKFEIFKGNIKHRIKNDGQLEFIRQTLMTNDIEVLWQNNNALCSLYLLAMVDYLSRLNQIPIYTKYNYLRLRKMENKIYPLSIKTSAMVLNVDVEQLTSNAIPEFLRFNIVEGDIFNVQ